MIDEYAYDDAYDDDDDEYGVHRATLHFFIYTHRVKEQNTASWAIVRQLHLSASFYEDAIVRVMTIRDT
jgi:hypothetical protein